MNSHPQSKQIDFQALLQRAIRLVVPQEAAVEKEAQSDHTRPFYKLTLGVMTLGAVALVLLGFMKQTRVFTGSIAGVIYAFIVYVCFVLLANGISSMMKKRISDWWNQLICIPGIMFAGLAGVYFTLTPELKSTGWQMFIWLCYIPMFVRSLRVELARSRLEVPPGASAGILVQAAFLPAFFLSYMLMVNMVTPKPVPQEIKRFVSFDVVMRHLLVMKCQGQNMKTYEDTFRALNSAWYSKTDKFFEEEKDKDPGGKQKLYDEVEKAENVQKTMNFYFVTWQNRLGASLSQVCSELNTPRELERLENALKFNPNVVSAFEGRPPS